jgi:hypothetical protein
MGVGLGVMRNLSLQGMYIDSALSYCARDRTQHTACGGAFVLSAGQQCKMRITVIHGGRHGCGVQFPQKPRRSLALLAHYGLSLKAEDDLLMAISHERISLFRM